MAEPDPPREYHEHVYSASVPNSIPHPHPYNGWKFGQSEPPWFWFSGFPGRE